MSHAQRGTHSRLALSLVHKQVAASIASPIPSFKMPLFFNHSACNFHSFGLWPATPTDHTYGGFHHNQCKQDIWSFNEENDIFGFKAENWNKLDHQSSAESCGNVSTDGDSFTDSFEAGDSDQYKGMDSPKQEADWPTNFGLNKVVGRGESYYQRFGYYQLGVRLPNPQEFMPRQASSASAPKRLKKSSPKPQKTECAFCKNNPKDPELYKTHMLKDADNNIVCPVLRAYKCPRCNNQGGPRAHTLRYCPLVRLE